MTSNFNQSNSINLQIVSNPSTNIISSSFQTRKYWCHICKKEFSHILDENSDIKCYTCGKTFCELLENEDTSNESHPIHFEPFVLNQSANTDNANNTNNTSNAANINLNNNNRTNTTNSNNRRNIFEISSRRGTDRLFDLLTNYIIIQNDNIDNIINQIMINDTNKYGNPPASKNAVEKLKKYKINEDKIKEFGFENSCAVCKDEFNIGEECLSMPCNHYFHGNCLMPWLKERNSCPVCRYELPTDDADFEEMKKIKMRNDNNNNIINNNNNANVQG